MTPQYPSSLLRAIKFRKKITYKKRVFAFRCRCFKRRLKRMRWVRNMIRKNILVLLAVAGPTLKSFVEYYRRIEAEKNLMTAVEDRIIAEAGRDIYQSQAEGLRKTYDDLGISLFEKIKAGDRYIMLSTNEYYDGQFTRRRKKDGLDYMGREDHAVHDSANAESFNEQDNEVALTGNRKWYRDDFIAVYGDTLPIATIKGRRIEYNGDTIVFGGAFLLKKMLKELNLKEIEQ